MRMPRSAGPFARPGLPRPSVPGPRMPLRPGFAPRMGPRAARIPEQQNLAPPPLMPPPGPGPSMPDFDMSSQSSRPTGPPFQSAVDSPPVEQPLPGMIIRPFSAYRHQYLTSKVDPCTERVKRFVEP